MIRILRTALNCASLFLVMAVSHAAEMAMPWQLEKGQGNFLILSDVHFDPYADKSLVPQLAKAPVEKWDSIFSSSRKTQVAGYGVDTNFPLWHSCLEAIKQFNQVDYVIVNGDYLSHHFLSDFNKTVHGDHQAYLDFVEKTLIYVSQSLENALPGVPFYFCLGNNDSDCDDYEMTPHTEMLLPLRNYWKTVADSTKAVAQFNEGGYYVVKHPTLKDHEFIVLNDVFWSVKYMNACGKEADEPGAVEMNWLNKQLEEAQKDHLKVTMITHMPLGIHARNASEHSGKNKPPKRFWKENYFVSYGKMMYHYRDTVIGMFSGHTHMDDFRVLTDAKGTPYLFDHITPAVSPVRNNNPGFQMMKYDQATGQVMDMATYYDDLTAKTDGWSLEYTFDKAYGASSYDAKSLAQLSSAMSSDSGLQAKYILYVPVSSTHDSPITGENWKYFHCAQTVFNDQDYASCCH